MLPCKPKPHVYRYDDMAVPPREEPWIVSHADVGTEAQSFTTWGEAVDYALCGPHDLPFDQWLALISEGAYREGWDIFECHDYGHAPYEIQADGDCEEITGGDAGAARLVAARALAGSPLHVLAVKFLRRFSPGEYRRVVALHKWDVYDNGDLPLDVQAWIYEGINDEHSGVDLAIAGHDEFYQVPGRPGRWRIAWRYESYGQIWFDLAYQPAEDHFGYPIYDPVAARSSRRECLDFIANPPPWWANPGGLQ
jgi:hypothetical protein